MADLDALGDTYNDLGITIKDDHDHNLGYTTLVNGAPTTNNRIKINTSEPGEHEITYTVTDADGTTTTATRIVIIEPLTHSTAESPEPPEEETPPESESPALPTPEQPAPTIEPEPQETPQPTETSTNNNEAPQDLTSSTSPATTP